MPAASAKVPATLLLAGDLSPAAKLVWMALHLHDRAAPARPAQVEAASAIMNEYLSLLLNSDDWENNARPGFLVNPQTEARLDLDRYYPAGLAFAYQGAQHDDATESVSAAEAAAQQARDYMKLGICTGRGGPLVVIRWQDLTLAAMQRKVRAAMADLQYMRRPQRLPSPDGDRESMAGQHTGGIPRLRDLTGYETVIELLESSSHGYRLAARRDG